MSGAGDGFGERHSSVVAGLDDQAMQQVVDRDRGRRIDEHLRAAPIDLPCPNRDVDHLLQVEPLFLDRREGQVGGHDLDQRRRLNAHVSVLGAKLLAAGGIQQ